MVAGAATLAFGLIELAPGEVFSETRLDGTLSADAASRLAEARGLSGSAMARYTRWASGLTRGELGQSFVSGIDVVVLLRERLANTLLLSTTALVLAWLVGLPIGVLAGWRLQGTFAWLSAGLSTTLVLIPELVLALLALMVAVTTGWFPAGGMTASTGLPGGIADIARHLVLPALVVAAHQLPLVLRHTEQTVRSLAHSRLMTGLRARGVSHVRIVFSHVLRLALAPLVTLGGLTLGSLLSSTLMVEAVFSWPGLGPLLIQSVLARDTPVVLGVTLAGAILLAGARLAGDVLVAFCDPRVELA